MNNINDKILISESISRYVQCLDEKNFGEDFLSLFTEDVDITLVDRHHKGIIGVDNFQAEGVAPFSATHHMTSDHIIDIKDNSATTRANISIIHQFSNSEAVGMKILSVQAVIKSSLVLEKDKWKINKVVLIPVFINNARANEFKI